MKSVSKKKSTKKPETKKTGSKTRSPRLPVAPTGPYYRVEMAHGAVMRPHPAMACVDEETAKTGAESLKMVGVGGRLIKLDGTPDGEIVEKWSGAEEIDRAKESEVAEKKV